MGPEAKANLVPKFLKAKTPGLLQELMLNYNLIKGQYTVYQDIALASDGYWYAWYYEEIQHFSRVQGSKVVDK